MTSRRLSLSLDTKNSKLNESHSAFVLKDFVLRLEADTQQTVVADRVTLRACRVEPCGGMRLRVGAGF